MNSQTPKYPKIVIDLEYGKKTSYHIPYLVQEAFPDRNDGNEIYMAWYKDCYDLPPEARFLKTMNWFSVINIFHTR
jgi:hypothetical protein